MLEEINHRLGGAEEDRRGAKRDSEDRTEDALRSFPIVLPKLVDPGSKHSALHAGDWIAQVKPLISDVSSRAGEWWEKVVEKTMERCMRWLDAPPLQRLHIQPAGDEELPKGFERLVQRVTNMLLSAVPETVKGELIATRQLSPQGIFFKVLKVYQPGGLHERSSTLAALTASREASTPQEAVEELRLWKRQWLRTKELGASLPDPTLLTNALDGTMKKMLQSDEQAAFRVNTYRMQHSVDVRPTQEGVQHFYEVLLAEAEMLVGAVAVDKKSEGDPAVKAIQGPTTPQRQEGASTPVCEWWGSEGGCRRGKACRFLLVRICSSKTHRKADCPYKGQGYEQREHAGGSGGQLHQQPHPYQGTPSKAVKGKEKGDSAGKGKAKGGKDSGKERKGEEKGEKESEKPAVRAATTETEVKEHQEGAPVTADREMMQEVTSLLRSLRVEPRLRAFKIMKVGAKEDRVLLLDGGDTHCLRQAKSDEEWEKAIPTTVQLASGSVTMRMHEEVGTLLSREAVQPIIPVAKMTEVGYKVVWTQDQCCFEHPKFADGFAAGMSGGEHEERPGDHARS